MRTYELLFIVAPTEGEDVVDGLIEQLRTVAGDRGATVAKVDKMGRRRLAYPIRQSHTTFSDGNYVVLTIEGSGAEIAELERRLRVAEPVMRHMTVRTDLDIKRAEKFRAKRQAKGRPAGGGGGDRRGGRGGRSLESEAFTDAPEEESAPAAPAAPAATNNEEGVS